ncbi:hypothetical protein D3C76_1423870 [compost metagenome]
MEGYILKCELHNIVMFCSKLHFVDDLMKQGDYFRWVILGQMSPGKALDKISYIVQFIYIFKL